jgi:hypothetical protein
METNELDLTTSTDNIGLADEMKKEERLYIETLKTIAQLAVKYLIKDDKERSFFIARLELSMPRAMKEFVKKFEKELEDNLIKKVTDSIKQVNMPQYLDYIRTTYRDMLSDKYKDDRRTGMVKNSVVHEINTIKHEVIKMHMFNYFTVPEDEAKTEDFLITPLSAPPPAFKDALASYIDENMKKAAHRQESWIPFKSMIPSKKSLPKEVSVLEKPLLEAELSGGTKRYRRRKSRRRQSIKKQRNINF